jgi:hypothetical protein
MRLTTSCQPRSNEIKKESCRQYHRGRSATRLAQRFDLTSRHNGHIIHGLDAARIMELPLASIGNEPFARTHELFSDRRSLVLLLPFSRSFIRRRL